MHSGVPILHTVDMHQKTAIEKITTGVGSVPSLLLHTVAFIGFFSAAWSGLIAWDLMLLALTTIVSLEAIYLAIFIQMTVNRQAVDLAEVSEDVEDIQEDIEEISQDIEEISQDVDEIQGDVGEINEDTDNQHEKQHSVVLEQLTNDIRQILIEVESLKEK